ncbi:MAG: hypothetical protein RIS52_576 [Pseudomonadota bacterium]
MRAPILALLAGKAKPFARGELSAIGKVETDGSVKVTCRGLVGDEQADRRVHGGPDKALHHYPADHYDFWRACAAEHPLLDVAGAFGENVSTRDITEAMVCIGDRFQLGSALVEISQGRQPCWKQGHFMEWATLPAIMVRERRSGWYYRVIEEGEAKRGDLLSLVDRPQPDWTVERVFGLLIAGDHKRDPAALPVLRDMPHLFGGWRERAAALMGS